MCIRDSISTNNIVQFSGILASPVAIAVPNKSEIGLVNGGADGGAAQECLIYYWRNGVYSRHRGRSNPFHDEPDDLSVAMVRTLEDPGAFADVSALEFPAQRGGSLHMVPPALAARASRTAAAGGVSAFEEGLPEFFSSDKVYAGYLSRASICLTSKYETIASVPVWDHDSQSYHMAAARSLSHLAFPDVPDHDDSTALKALFSWMEQVYTALDAVGVAEYLSLIHISEPTRPY